MAILPAAAVYVAYKIWETLPAKKWLKVALMAIYGLAAVAFALSITGVIDHLPMPLARAAYIFGSSWAIALVYFFIAFLILDILRLMRILPAKFLKNNIIVLSVICALTAGLLIYGGINYRHKNRQEMTVESAKITKPVKIVLMSDLHAGYHNSYNELRRWVDMVNTEKPDLILLAGDLVDRSLRAVTADHDASCLKHFAAPVYACLGNHEYYAGVDEAKDFYRKCGITLIQDSVVNVCGISIIGRDDDTNEERRSLYQLTRKAPKGQFTLVLDHQPKDLLEAELEKVDFQFSGHTHSGQIWPVNWLEHVTFENAYGPLKKGDTQYYVTSGMGLWGGRFRIGTRSEYLVLNLVPETTPEN
ncbi:MAG: metallophosphoesterase [Bacteroidales bacterium]|nr:metallophosphoesterase [Bacteroidales bacterium]